MTLDSGLSLGIEIGGTKLQLGVGSGHGAPLIALRRLDIDASRGARQILHQIEAVGRELMRQHEIVRIGIGFGGPVDRVSGRVLKSHQVAGWEDVPLVDWCRRQLGVEADLGNDCDVAALAEARFGAGRGHRVVFFVTVGTGIGGGLVIDGVLHGVETPAVAEIGHLRPGPAAADPRTTVESMASGRGIEESLRNRLHDDTRPAAVELLASCHGQPQQLTAKAIAAAAGQGNALAAEVMNEAFRVLGWAIAQVVTLIGPETVVVGGGVSLIGERSFFVPLRREVARYVFPPLASAYEIVAAELGEEVVVHGALALAADGLGGVPRS